MVTESIHGATFSEAYFKAAKAVLAAPVSVSRGLESREILDMKIVIDSPTTALSLSGQRLRYLFGEAVWYAAGDTSIDWILQYSKFWERICDSERRVSSNYGHRIFRTSKTFFTALEMLRHDQGSRQAICHINVPTDLYRGNKDIPCTLGLQFFIRDDQLHLIVSMRSNDIWRGATFDIPNFFLFQQTARFLLLDKYPNLQLGQYIHRAGSFHVYKEHYHLLEDMTATAFHDIPFQLSEPMVSADGQPAPLLRDLYRFCETSPDTISHAAPFFGLETHLASAKVAA